MTSVDGKTTDVRIIFRTEEFEKFYNSLNTRVKDKFEYTFELVQTVYALPVKYIKTNLYEIWGIERSGFFNGREKWAKDFENQRV